ncbi:MAG: hypothetical protein AAF626_13880 [Pseudomonadota bacterium]
MHTNMKVTPSGPLLPYFQSVIGAARRVHRLGAMFLAHLGRRAHCHESFGFFLRMSDNNLRDVGLSREKVQHDRAQYRLTGELPDYIR